MSVPKAMNVFLGMNEASDSDTQLKFGEASKIQNYRITDNYKLKQIEGYESILDTPTGQPIRCQWYGSIGGNYYHLFVSDGHLYYLVDGEHTEIGSLTDAPTFMFSLNSKVYIMNGHNYKSWDGITLTDVIGYIPTIATATPPSGGGTDLEPFNLLTGKKTQLFSGNGTDTTFVLREQNIDSDLLLISIGGVVKTEGTHFTVNRTAGTVNFLGGSSPHGAPSNNANNTSITWTKENSSYREEIISCRKAVIFGTRVHVFGGKGKNKRYFSGLEGNSPIITAEYYPAINVSNVGSDEFEITDMVNHNDNYQIILTNGSKSYYSYYSNIGDVVSFPVFELNDSVGNFAFGQAIPIQDFVYSFQYGVNRWETTAVQSQRNAPYISGRAQQTLDDINLTEIITFDWQRNRELWITNGNQVIVYGYRTDTWYKFLLADKITSMITINGEMYFGTDEGHIMKFDKELRTFNGQAIEAEWEMGFYDWGEEWLRKFANNTWIALQPATKINVDVYWITDRDTVEKQASTPIGYNLMDYESIDYEDWSYETSMSPKPKRVRTKAKKFTYFKLILRNSKLNYTSTILSINLLGRIGGESK